MSTRTANLALVKPAGDENVSRTVINGNYDILDTEVAQRVKRSDIVNSLTSTATNAPLSAYQGKLLSDEKVNKSDVVNNLSSTAANAPLSANQGKVIADVLRVNWSNVKWFEDAMQGNNYGLQCSYHYENADVTTYKLPNSCVDIRVCVRSGRGTAIAIQWNNNNNTMKPNMWICTYHDTSWSSWVKLLKDEQEQTDSNSSQSWTKRIYGGIYIVTAIRPYGTVCSYLLIRYNNYNTINWMKIAGDSNSNITAVMDGANTTFTLTAPNFKDYKLSIIRIGEAT